jgi:hypothetical protein
VKTLFAGTCTIKMIGVVWARSHTRIKYGYRRALQNHGDQVTSVASTRSPARLIIKAPGFLIRVRLASREISTGARAGERSQAEIALAEFIGKTRKPQFGRGRPDEVLIGDCLAHYADNRGAMTGPMGSQQKS